ncbi:CRE-ZTF-15 protein [Caenorhabditis remanei]|uniref:CRE-ZTF-15 protein n=1 Tax=Caenorhabditis remanei TaxID=31234 RepID=E3NE33_CAERE|nr:CRE-ZTF-15 protein [Caenorhabditis remanei]
MLTCGFCEKTFSTRTHMYLHLSQEYKLHHCTACNISFSSNWHKERHNCLDAMAPTKKSIIDKFSIDNPAGEVKEEIDDDEAYGNTVGAALKKGFSCDLCGKQYYHEHWSIKHREKCARKVQRQTLDAKVQEFKCSICLRQYNTQYWFDCHKKKCSTTPTSTVILPYDTKVRCDLCGKMFQHARSLEFHLRHCRAKQKRNEAAHATRHATHHATHHYDMPILEDNSMASTSSIIKKRRIREDSDDVVPPIVAMFGEEAELPGGAESCEEAEPQEDTDDEEYEGTNPFTVPMKCSICSHICTGVSHLLTHRKNHHGTESMLQCGRCQAHFNSISSIRRHMNQEYSLYICQKCGRNCKDSSDRRDHLCPPGRRLATLKTVSRRRLQSVMSTVTTASSSARKCVKCPTCFESFATSTIMFNHRMTCDPRRVSDEKRAELNTVEEDSSTRESSEEPEDDEETQILKCPDCPSQFNFLCDIVRHRHESHGKERFECLFCPRHFAILRTLQDHHNLETKRWTCHRCDRPFSRRYQSEYHEAYCGVQRQDGPRKFPIYN